MINWIINIIEFVVIFVVFVVASMFIPEMIMNKLSSKKYPDYKYSEDDKMTFDEVKTELKKRDIYL